METGWRRNYLRYKSFFLNIMVHYRERSDWKAYLEILLSLVTVSVFSIFALRPTILTIAELIKQIEEKKDTVAKMDKKIQDLGRAQTLFDRESQNINLLKETSIPQTPIFNVVARQIEGLSSKYSLPVSSFNLGGATIMGVSVAEEDNRPKTEEEKAPKAFSEIRFAINAVTNVDGYLSIAGFLKDFEKLRMPPQLKTVEVSVKEEGEVIGKVLTLTIEGVLPYLQPELQQTK